MRAERGWSLGVGEVDGAEGDRGGTGWSAWVQVDLAEVDDETGDEDGGEDEDGPVDGVAVLSRGFDRLMLGSCCY